MTGEREIEEAPRQTEGSKETEPSFEAVMEHGAELERAVDEGPEKLRAEAKQRLERMVNASDTTEEERRAMPELEKAARELAVVQADASRLAGETKVSLGGILAKAKRYGRGLAGAATLMGAMTFAEGCATIGAPTAQAMERVEQRPDDRPTSEQVSREAVEALRADKALMAELGPEKVKDIIGAVESWDEHRIDAAIHELSGAPVSRLQKERVARIRILSDAEWSEEKKKDAGFDLGALAVTENDGMKVRASAFVRKDGRVDALEIRHTMTHEDIHAKTTDSDKVLMGQQQRYWDAQNVSTDFNEGVTELMAQRVMEKIGEKPDDQSYAGGNFAAAYMLERLVGTKDVAADFFAGKTDRIKSSLDAKFGKGTGEAVLRDHFNAFVKLVVSRPEGLAASLDMVGLAAVAGLDPRTFAETAKRDGIREEYRVSEKGDCLTITKEIDGKLVVANAAVQGSRTAGAYVKPLKLLVLTVGGGWNASQHEDIAKSVIAGAKKIEAAYAKTVKDAGLAEDWRKDPQLKSDVEQVIKAETEAYGLDDAFNVVIDISDEMKPIQDEYGRETDPAKRKEIEKRASAESERLARQALADIEAKVAAAW